MKRTLAKAFWVLAGVAAGAAAAAVVVILIAPESGADTRLRIQNRWQEVVDAGQHAAEIKRLELRAELQALSTEPSGS